MGEWKPDAMRSFGNPLLCTLLLRVGYPADVAGVWRCSVSVQEGDLPYTLRFKQNFQEVSGHVTIPGDGEFVSKRLNWQGPIELCRKISRRE